LSDIVGHLKQDFDTGAYMSGIYLYVIIVLFHYFLLYPTKKWCNIMAETIFQQEHPG